MAASHFQKSLCLELQKGKFCYVSESTITACNRLSQATRHYMSDRGYRNALVSLSANATWDRHIITAIWQGLHPKGAAWLAQWLNTTAHLSARQRLIQFADELLLSDLCEGPLLICLDNIDSLLGMPSVMNDLLAWVTHCYELRDTYLTYRHLSIVAFGTSLPASSSSSLTPIIVFQGTPPAQTTAPIKPVRSVVQGIKPQQPKRHPRRRYHPWRNNAKALLCPIQESRLHSAAL